jgi:hypothetical protein
MIGDIYAGTMVRWYNDISWGENGEIVYQTKLRFRINLPKMNDKLKLIFEPATEDSITNLFPTNTTEQESSLGLNYDWVKEERQSLSLKVTITPSVEIRYRYVYPLSASLLSRYTQKLYQRNENTGTASLFDLDFGINDNFLFRWANAIKIETDNLIELGSGLTLYQYLSATQVLNYKTSLTSQEKPHHYISNYHLSIAYRQNIFREWFYYEIRSEINWDREVTTQRESATQITLRLEILFDNI